jgi:para-nitrobenzyl esterase
MMKKRPAYKINRRTFLGQSALAVSVLGSGLLVACSRESSPGAAAGSTASSTEVETAYGRINGTVNDGILSFRGVPYGGSTAGAGRFMPPSRPTPWTGVRDAIELGQRAPQQFAGGEPPEVAAMDRREAMGEDCLALNVYTPSTSAANAKRPVMVWLHGGGLNSGSAGFDIYNGTNLAKAHDVVVVGVNHRLNAFGYLYLADLGGEKYSQAGNVGHLDIIAALEWVRDNIEHFGGDPGNVTIFGQSGGGRKVSILQGMPAAKGLFHRAIMQSGSALRGQDRAQATENADRFLHSLGLDASGIDKLQQLPYEQLVELMARERFNFGMVVDGHTLPASMFEPGATEISADVPIMLGTVETEEAWSPRIQIDPIDMPELVRRVKEDIRVTDANARKLIGVYQNKFPGIENIDVYLKMQADDTRRMDTQTLADRKSALGKGAAYVYYFMWHSPVRDGKMKAYHTLDIPFAFRTVDVAQSMTGTGQDRYALQDRMSAAWTSFARTGNPNHDGLPAWPAYTADQRATMILNNECQVANDPNKDERQALIATPRVA